MLRIDAKNRRVDLTQRSEEERAADKALAEKGAQSVRVSGLNSLGAALARAGIRKQDFEDLSQVWQLPLTSHQGILSRRMVLRHGLTMICAILPLLTIESNVKASSASRAARCSSLAAMPIVIQL